MRRLRLAQDYLIRSQKRIRMLGFLKAEEAFADVVREAQEVVGLLLPKLGDFNKANGKRLPLKPYECDRII